MTRAEFLRYQNMPYDERVRRIGELLGKACVRFLTAQRAMQVKGAPSEPTAEPFRDVADEVEKRILEHLALAGSAAPIELLRFLSLTSATLHRRLQRLRAAGLVVVHGKSRGARYELGASLRRAACTSASTPPRPFTMR